MCYVVCCTYYLGSQVLGTYKAKFAVCTRAHHTTAPAKHKAVLAAGGGHAGGITATTTTRKKINGHKSLRLADKQARGYVLVDNFAMQKCAKPGRADALFCPGQPWQKCILELGCCCCAVLLCVLTLLHRGLQNEPDTSSPPPSSVYIQIGHKIKKVQGSNYV